MVNVICSCFVKNKKMTIQNNLQIKKLDQAFLNNCMKLI